MKLMFSRVFRKIGISKVGQLFFFASLILLFLTSSLFAAETIRVDFSKESGPIKALHGINNSPVTYGEPLPELRNAGIPYCRLHDTAGTYGGTVFVDIPNIFPNFDADPNDPASYDFAFTDAYLKGLVASGMKPFYRLGVTIENHYKIKACRIHPPKDYQKFATICEKIVRHYNEGWNNGFQYGMEYWEIWNEPENPPMWTGTREQYFELYRVTANHLKKCFPNIKVGGYAGCGFYAINRPEMKKNKFYNSFIDWFDAFLKFVTDPQTKAPLDFYSWHLYTKDPQEIIVHAEYVDKKLKEYKLDRTESIFDEWNYMQGGADTFDAMKEMPGAAFVASAFCLMQNSPIDKAMYYDALPQRTYGGLYYFPSRRVSKTYYSFLAFNELYKLGTAVPCSFESKNSGLYAIAAKNAKGAAALLVVNNGKSAAEISFVLNGRDLDTGKVKILDKDRLLTSDDSLIKNGKMTLNPLTVVLIVLPK